jgi:hypothetical protein
MVWEHRQLICVPLKTKVIESDLLKNSEIPSGRGMMSFPYSRIACHPNFDAEV